MAKLKKKKLHRHVALDGTIYDGELREPIRLPNLSLPAAPYSPRHDDLDEFESWPFDDALSGLRQDELLAGLLDIERRNKLRALFMKFSIDPNGRDAWKRLAWRLARAHVPGFQVARRRGRRRKTEKTDSQILFAVTGVRIKNPNCTISWACKELTKKGAQFETMTPQTVRASHNRANRKLGRPFEKTVQLAKRVNSQTVLEMVEAELTAADAEQK
ncbi:MAG: hypothetical protein ACT4OG_06805 [Alphaproteobacteria bacterium]